MIDQIRRRWENAVDGEAVKSFPKYGDLWMSDWSLPLRVFLVSCSGFEMERGKLCNAFSSFFKISLWNQGKGCKERKSFLEMNRLAKVKGFQFWKKRTVWNLMLIDRYDGRDPSGGSGLASFICFVIYFLSLVEFEFCFFNLLGLFFCVFGSSLYVLATLIAALGP